MAHHDANIGASANTARVAERASLRLDRLKLALSPPGYPTHQPHAGCEQRQGGRKRGGANGVRRKIVRETGVGCEAITAIEGNTRQTLAANCQIYWEVSCRVDPYGPLRSISKVPTDKEEATWAGVSHHSSLELAVDGAG